MGSYVFKEKSYKQYQCPKKDDQEYKAQQLQHHDGKSQ